MRIGQWTASSFLEFSFKENPKITKQINKKTEDLSNPIKEYTEHCIQQQKNTVFSNGHGTFSRINHMVSFKTFNIEIPSISSIHSGIKLEINSKKKTEKFTNIWNLNNILLNSQWVKKEITREIRTYLETNEN